MKAFLAIAICRELWTQPHQILQYCKISECNALINGGKTLAHQVQMKFGFEQ